MVTGHMIRTTMENMQVEVGIGTPIMEADYKVWGHLATQLWIKTAWRFLHHAKAKLKYREAPVPKRQRENNEFLMEMFQASGYFSNALLKRLN